jgi:hypothetical protein
MSNRGNYLTNIAVGALAGRDGFAGNGVEASRLYGSSINLLFVIIFSAGAAYLSYNYNVAIGTSGGMTVVYGILSFMFSYFYYPYYALVLAKNGRGGRR